MQDCRRQTGFTLVELMVTVAVLGIIAAIAMPRMTAFANLNRLNGAAGELTAAMQLGRSEAIRRNSAVTVCASSNGSTCTASTAWNRWIILGTDNTSGASNVIRDETPPAPLRVSGPSAGVRFRPSGLLDAATAINVCIPTSEPAQNQRVVSVMVSGTVRTSAANGAGACP